MRSAAELRHFTCLSGHWSLHIASRHLSRAAGEVAALAAGGGLFEHRSSGLAGEPHYPLPGLKARPLPEGIGVYAFFFTLPKGG